MILKSTALRVACLAVLATSLAACGGDKKESEPPTTPAPTTSAPTTPKPKPKPPAPINPFTGRDRSPNDVVAVKIDDTANGRPQLGINKADIVYIEEVEGGLTRLLAVYNTSLPTVEAVRSTRAADPEILAQYGPIIYVASGGAPHPMQVLDRSNLQTVINDRGGPGFTRDPNRPVPYNLTSDLRTVAGALKGAKAKSIGLNWKAYHAGLASTPRGASVQTVVGGTPVRFDFDSNRRRYVRIIDGSPQFTADNKVISTPNVIVQFCDVVPDPRDIDTAGNVAKYTNTIGTGRVVVFRNGHRLEGTWQRSTAEAGTRLVSRTGKPIGLEPGGAWFVLVANGAPLS